MSGASFKSSSANLISQQQQPQEQPQPRQQQQRQRKNPLKTPQDKTFSYVQLTCSYCKFKKRKCNGENPCSNCEKNNQSCVYFADNDRRRRKYHTDYINYLEGKSDVLTTFINEFLKDLPELSSIFHEKLSQVIQVSQMKAEDIIDESNEDSSHMDDYLLDMMNEASKLKLDEDDNSRVTNSKSFLNHSNEYDDIDLSQQESPFSAYSSSTLDASTTENECNPLSMNGLNIVFKDESFRLHLIDCFEKNFALYYYCYCTVIPSIKKWEFSSPVPSKQLLMCSVFAVGAVYSNHPYALKSRKLFIAELEFIAINACRYPLDIYLVLGLSLLSIYELGMGNDSISYLFDSMACSLTQHMGLHISYDETGDSKSANYAPRASPILSSILWGICLQDRVITSICGVQACIHFKRIIAHSYQTVLGPESDKYVAELYFASQTRLWYIFDRFMDQICSENSDIGDTQQRTKLLETALNSLTEFKNSIPTPLISTNENNNVFVTMLHYTCYSLICQLHKKFIKVTKSSSQQVILSSVMLAKILKRYQKNYPFEMLPYNSTYLLFSNALVYLIVLAKKKESIYANLKEEDYYRTFRSYFQTCITLLKALSRYWKRPKKDLNILRNMCIQSGVHFPELTDLMLGEEVKIYSQFPDLGQTSIDGKQNVSSQVEFSVNLGTPGSTAKEFAGNYLKFDTHLFLRDIPHPTFFEPTRPLYENFENSQPINQQQPQQSLYQQPHQLPEQHQDSHSQLRLQTYDQPIPLVFSTVRHVPNQHQEFPMAPGNIPTRSVVNDPFLSDEGFINLMNQVFLPFNATTFGTLTNQNEVLFDSIPMTNQTQSPDQYNPSYSDNTTSN